jgi:hypothetical protein
MQYKTSEQNLNRTSFREGKGVNDNGYVFPQYVPTTKVIMTNLYQGFPDECLKRCRRGAFCLKFPWDYQTCFDLEDRALTFSVDHLAGQRRMCQLGAEDPMQNRRCPDDQVCLQVREQDVLNPPKTPLYGFCIEKRTYDMNWDAFHKGRYQKQGGIQSHEWPDRYTAKQKIPNALKTVKSSFDHEFEKHNGIPMPTNKTHVYPYQPHPSLEGGSKGNSTLTSNGETKQVEERVVALSPLWKNSSSLVSHT